MGVRLLIFGGAFAAAVAAGLRGARYGPAGFLALFTTGLLAWTAIEYLMHRLAFHGFAPHTEHHANPADPACLLAPLWLSTPVALALFGAFSLAARSWSAGASIIAGVIAGYLAYEAIHLSLHGTAQGGALLRALRKYHFYHHYADDRVCFGVTSPLWDLAFGTVPVKRRRNAEAARNPAT
jgi:sterol desaturase/sphingolipid hydroxylase (fatty acid hydroxylase superfamily)